jgi:hypothetical protein
MSAVDRPRKRPIAAPLLSVFSREQLAEPL